MVFGYKMLDSLREIWRYRALVAALTTRHVSQRYRGSVLGFFWSLLNPLCLMLVYTLVFSYYIRFSQVEHYTLFLFVGLLPWLWASSAISEGTSAVVSSGHLITKSMFPPQILPLVAVLSTLVNFILTLPVLILFLLFGGIGLHWSIVILPVIVIIQFVLLTGIALVLSAFNVKFRDVQHVVANLLSLLFFLCPVLYPVSVVPERFQFTMLLNPFALLTIFYHQVLLEGVFPSFQHLLLLAALAGVLLGVGLLVFNKYRESFAENL